MSECALGRRWRSTSAVVTTSIAWPSAASCSERARVAGIGPPNATAGHQAGAAKRMRRREPSTRWTVAFCRVTDTRKPRLLVVNQYYWPGVEATAQLLTELCEALADEYEIRVLSRACSTATSSRRSGSVRNGVEIVRVRVDLVRARKPRPARAELRRLHRQRAARGPDRSRPDVVLCMTDPPMIGDVGARGRAAVPGATCSSSAEDVFPEIAIAARAARKTACSSRRFRSSVGLYLQPRRPGRRDR